MNENLLKPYNPEETEARIYKTWEESNLFHPETSVKLGYTDPSAEPFTIIMPPPNANGHLHAGHSLFITLEDIMVRYARLQGKKALWVPGADHAGFETQIVYEKKLEKEGRSRFDLTREELYKEIMDFTLENKKHMEHEVKSMGASCDWSREKFTLDPDVIAVVHQTFQTMFDDGLIYRGKRIINWCSKHQTTLSDVETDTDEQTDSFYYLKYGPFTIGTSRPETKFGDKYVVMHPNDKRYAHYNHGDTLTVEWINGPITTTIIKDESIDMEFGTGVMTITPWHDKTDFEIAERHNLDKGQIIDFKGKLLPITEEFAGMKILEARPKIIKKLQSKGLVEKIDEQYIHRVPRCYKCATIIEPQIMDQWFVTMEPLAKLALAAVEKKELTFIPDQYEKVFKYWMEHTIDWNISRQIVWGIKIPAKLCTVCDFAVADIKNTILTCEKCGAKVKEETDTFDTWFSSGQWPLITLGYPDGNDMSYYPTDIMETGHDLIFKWVPRMVIFGLYLQKQVPFKTVYMHGLINDKDGKKMSKSKGNVVNPLELTKKYGTDALRMALVVSNPPGSNMSLSEDKIKAHKHFSNKIWNIARFVLTNTEGFDFNQKPPLTLQDQETLTQCGSVLSDITSDMDNLRLHLASEKIYHYIWHNFADDIIERSKVALLHGTTEEKASAQWALYTIFSQCLIALHPFMPFITEEIWSFLPHKKDRPLLMVERWPVAHS